MGLMLDSNGNQQSAVVLSGVSTSHTNPGVATLLSFQSDGVMDSQWGGKKQQTMSNWLEIMKNHIVFVVHHFNRVVLADGFTAVVWTDRGFLTHMFLCCLLQLHFLTATLCMHGTSDAQPPPQNHQKLTRIELRNQCGYHANGHANNPASSFQWYGFLKRGLRCPTVVWKTGLCSLIHLIFYNHNNNN